MVETTTRQVQLDGMSRIASGSVGPEGRAESNKWCFGATK